MFDIEGVLLSLSCVREGERTWVTERLCLSIKNIHHGQQKMPGDTFVHILQPGTVNVNQY